MLDVVLDMDSSVLCLCLCFVKQKTAYEMRISDWSSDVCSSDLKYRPFPNMTAPVLAWLPTRRKARLVDVRQLADGIGYTGKIGCTELRGTRQAERLVHRCGHRHRHLGRMRGGNHQGKVFVSQVYREARRRIVRQHLVGKVNANLAVIGRCSHTHLTSF